MKLLRVWILVSTVSISSHLNIPETHAMSHVREQVNHIISLQQKTSLPKLLSPDIPVTTSMLLGHTTKSSLLFWYRDFCSREKDVGICHKSYEPWNFFIDLDKDFETIEKIHTFVNTQIVWISDEEKYKKEDYRESLVDKKDWRWDCDKYVLTKFDMLIHAGIPHKAIRPVAVMLYNKAIKKYEWHLVLMIFSNKWILILDSFQEQIFIAQSLEDILGDKDLWYGKIVQMPSDESPQIWVKPTSLVH